MNSISSGSYASVAGNYAYTGYGTSGTGKTKANTAASSAGTNSSSKAEQGTGAVSSSYSDVPASKKTAVTGQTIGNPKLSEKAAKYYDQLKKKYSNMNFILVSEDMKQQAKANASSYANANNMVVLIDEDKIERMAEDENYRKQYEGIIANAASGLSQLGNSIAATGANVKGYGMQVNDNGTATYFAVLEKSSAAQKERIEKNAAKKKTEQKAQDKKAEKYAEQERIKTNKDKSNKISDDDDEDDDSVSDIVTITASSIEELLSRIQKESQSYLSDNILSDAEKSVGRGFDYFL